jgi:hypothetical protein
MLKINFSETAEEERWVLHGRLTDSWVDEFEASWKKNHRRDVARACIVDLNETRSSTSAVNALVDPLPDYRQPGSDRSLATG